MMAPRLIFSLALIAAWFAGAPAYAQAVSQACQTLVTVSPTTATDTLLVTKQAGNNIFVCGIEASSGGTNNFYLETTAAATCTGTLTQIGTTYYTINGWFKPVGTYIPGLATGQGKGLCARTTQSQPLSITVWYAQHP